MAKTRYTEADLVRKIDEAKQRAMEMCRYADTLDLEADALRGKQEQAHMLVSKRTEAKRIRKKSSRLMDSRIPSLSRALAVIRTGSLPGHKPFESIPLR